MAFSTLPATLLVVCLAATANSCIPRSQGEKTKDGLYLQSGLVSLTTQEPLQFLPGGSGTVIRRELFSYLLDLIAQREGMQALATSPITATLTTLMDSLITDICLYMRTELSLPNLDCTSVQELKALSSQLEITDMGIDLYGDIRSRNQELGFDSNGEPAGRFDSWRRNVHLPCVADEGCDVDMVEKLRKRFGLQNSSADSCL